MSATTAPTVSSTPVNSPAAAPVKTPRSRKAPAAAAAAAAAVTPVSTETAETAETAGPPAPAAAKVTKSRARAKAAPKVSEAPAAAAVPDADAATADVATTGVAGVAEAAAVEDAKKKYSTSAEVCQAITSAVAVLKERSALARTNKDRDTASQLTAVARELNALRKPIDKLARSKPVRKVSIDPTRNGFLRPMQVSKELADFMGCDPTEKRSRVEVTQRICAYIREKDLQDPSNRRNILVDDNLKRLLDYDPEVEGSPLCYYHIQGRVQKHFIKPVEPVGDELAQVSAAVETV